MILIYWLNCLLIIEFPPPGRFHIICLFCTTIYIFIVTQRNLNDLSKVAKTSRSNFVRRLQRQSSVALPKQRDEFESQEPIHRGTDPI